MRAAAAYESRPSGVLELLHHALREQTGDEGRFCTVCYASLRVAHGEVTLELACGGHPLPLVVHADSLCVHGDTPGAVEIARRVRAELEQAGVPLHPFA